ncbi:MAG TPA: S41 family peptidase [Acidobacteriota bacterium]|nr:S41 family peptidase [Acidobacteriota bacterium]
MIRIASVLIATVCFVLALTASVCAQIDAENLLIKMIEARGGADRLSEIKTSVMKGKIIMVSQGGVSGDVAITHVYPDKSLIEMVIVGTSIIQGFDGNIAWMDNPLAGGFQELPAAQTESSKREAVGDDALLNPEKYGIRYTYKGKDTDAGREYHVLEQIFQDGAKTTMYVDPESYLVHKTSINRGSLQQSHLEEAYYSDYRDTDGVMQAHKVSLFVNGQEAITYLFDQMTYNSEINADVFQAAEGRFSREELIADARELAAIIEDAHPDPYRLIGGKIAYHRHFQHVLHAIPEEGMTKNEFTVLLRPFVAAIGDAHTEVYAHHNVDLTAPGGLPLRFDVAGQSLVVSGVPGTQYESLVGALLVSVEDVSIDELGRRLRNLRPIDNQYHLLWYFTTNYLWYGPYLQELLPEWKNTNQLQVRLRQSAGDVVETVFDLPMNVTSLIEPESRITLPSTDESGFVADFLGPDRKTAYLRIDHMKYYRESFEARNSLGLQSMAEDELNAIPSATEFFRSLVKTMKDAGTKTLIVDLRRNEGGDALMADYLIYFLYGKSTTLQTRWNNITKLSKTYLEARERLTLDDINKSLAVPLVEGDYDFSEDYSGDVLSDASSMEEGLAYAPTFYREWESGSYESYYCPANVIVLTRPATFSAGFGVAIRLYRAGAILVGTPSGQAPNSGGNAIKWSLRNTGIAGRVSQTYVQNFPHDSELSRVLQVHYPLTAELLKFYDFDPNAEVLYALDLLPEIAERKR